MMQYSKQGLALTERFEGCSLVAYLDSAGVPTIGYGHTHGVNMGDTCSRDQADAWLFDDLQSASMAVNSLVKIILSQSEFDALVDFVFNLGVSAFAHSTLLKMLNENNLTGALAEFMKWDYSAGRACIGLLNRRIAERAEFQGRGVS